MKLRDKHIALIYATAVLLLWSTVATAFKVALRFWTPFELLFLAGLSSFMVLSLLMALRGKFRKLKHLPKSELYRLIFAGLLNPLIYYLILFKAYELLPAQYAQSINFTWPLVLTLAAMLLRQEKFHYLRIFALCVSFAGALILVLGGKQLPEGISTTGVLLAFSSTIFWVFYWLITKTVNTDPLISLWIPFGVSALCLGSLAIFFFRPAAYPLPGLGAAVYIGLFEMSITFLLWLNALRRSSSTALVSNCIYAVPFLSLLFIRYILNEAIQPATVIGLLLILAGIILQMSVKRES
jgi:drug/metabolite transporter (DMT)-like permease